jgi:hypothetical protein
MALNRFSSKSSQMPNFSAPRSGIPLRWRRFVGPAIIVFAAAIATCPQLYRGNSCGHDFDFHLVSWFDCLSAWRQGIFYPHWAPSPNYGAGEPRFIFYPPLTWMLGAALGLALPWGLVPIVLTYLFLAGTGFATRALARQAIPSAPATLAGCTAIYSGYALFTAYERSAFGELSGGFWIPLLLLYLLRAPNPSGPLLRRVFNGSAASLAVVLAGTWLSNVPLGVMASYLLAAITLAVAVLNRSWVPVARATVAATLGIGLSAFYLVPAALEQHWVDIRQATDDPGEMVENSFLFGHRAEPLLHVHNLELMRVSLIAVSMIAVSLSGLIIAWRRKTYLAERRRWIPLALIPCAVLLLQLPVSLPLWNLLPKLRLLQFPWRWLVALESPMAIFFAAAVWPRVSARRWLRIGVPAICACLFLAATTVAAIAFFQPCDEEDAVAPMVQVKRSGVGFQGTDEYAPVDADNSMVATGLPDACLVADADTTLGILDTPGANPDWWVEQRSCVAIYSAIPKPAKALPEHLHFVAILPHSGYLILRLRTYPAWRIMLNGQVASPFPQRDDGLIAVPVPKGQLDLAVDWTTTRDVLAGRWLTALSLLLFITMGLLERRINTPRRPGLS